jgi:hypothetical protein
MYFRFIFISLIKKGHTMSPFFLKLKDYIIPSIPPIPGGIPAGMAGASCGISEIMLQ